MGNIEQYTKSSKEKIKDLNVALQNQKVMAQNIHQNYYLKTLQGLPKQFQVNKTITHKSGILYTESSGQKVLAGVAKVLASQNWGTFENSIKSKIGKLVQQLVVSSSESYQKHSEYTVTFGALGTIIRIDYQIIAIKMQATAWGVEKESTIVIYDYIITNVNKNDFKKHQLAVIIQNSSLDFNLQLDLFNKATELCNLDQ